MAPSTTVSPGRRSRFGACPSTCRGPSAILTRAAGIADHLTLWDACHRSIQLLGGMSRFVLSTSAHIAALVNPPGQPTATYRAGEPRPQDWRRAPTGWRGAAARYRVRAYRLAGSEPGGNREGQMAARGDATASVSGEPQSSWRFTDLNQAIGEGGPRENRNRHIEQARPRGAASHRRRALSGFRRVRNDAACRWALLCRPVRRRAPDWSRTHRGFRVNGRTGSAHPHRRGVAGCNGPISGQPDTLGLKRDAAHDPRRSHHATRSRSGHANSDPGRATESGGRVAGHSGLHARPDAGGVLAARRRPGPRGRLRPDPAVPVDGRSTGEPGRVPAKEPRTKA